MSLSRLLILLAVTALLQPAFSLSTELVALNVTVTDRDGNVVRDLKPAAFSVAEDGKPQPIEQFFAASLPLSLVVVLDAGAGMAGRIGVAREATLALLERLGPDDEFVVLGFNDRVFTIARGTKKRDDVDRALAKVHPRGATAFDDAVTAGIRALDKARHRRRALVIISDGNGAVSNAREAAVAEVVRRSEALVYAIGVDPDHGGQTDHTDPAALQRLTKPTGGETLLAASSQAVVSAAERLGEELRSQYVIGFPPEHADDAFHRVQVDIRGCDGCRARTKAGFIASKILK